ncbi:MAG TPA: MarC family protein [Kofleriaceae bacterium]
MSDADWKFAVVALSAIFFVIDPLANVPLFLSITAADSPEQRRRVALRAAFATWLILSIFAAAGGLIFQAFGISLGAFKIAGGIMLLLMSIDMMRAVPSPTRSTPEERDEGRELERQRRDDLAIFPLAIPMLAGPGAIATVMVLMSRTHWKPAPTISVFAAVTITCLAAWLLMRSAANAERFLPKTLLRALERIMGLLLAAVAVEFIAGGVRDMIHPG